MRSRIVGAFCISFVLIGLAFWYRSHASEPSLSPFLISAASESSAQNDGFVSQINPRTPPEPISADVLGKQLFSELIALKSSGQATSENIETIAAKYAESILNFQIAKTADRSSLKTVTDSKENLLKYSQTVLNVRSKYASLISAASGEEMITDFNNKEFKSLMSYGAKLYSQAAAELNKISVPSALAEIHLKLVNNYLSSAEALETLAQASEDPIRIYAAMNMFGKNTTEENDLLTSIQNAVLFSVNI